MAAIRRATSPGGTGLLSSESAFAPRLGEFEAGGPVRGYYIDFRGKVPDSVWPPAWLGPPERQLHVATAQWGLGAFEKHLDGAGQQWLPAAVTVGEHLIGRMRDDGALPHGFPYPHTYRIAPPWVSGMAQGEAASLFVRLHLETGEARFADAARLALRPTELPPEAGGALSDVDGAPLLEEYPTDPPSHVLNGAIFAAWGVYDVGQGLGDAAAQARFVALADGLADVVHRWDTGYWSTYDLFPHPVRNLASPAYHLLHVTQLRALHRLHPRPELAAAADRFDGYRARAFNRRRALAGKVAFRLAVPRNRRLAHRLPWSR